MIYDLKFDSVEAYELTHDGAFSTRAGMVQGKAGDWMVYDPKKVVYVIGENPHENAHNWDLVKKSDFEKDYQKSKAAEDKHLPPVPTDLGIHQFDEQGKFLGYKTQAQLDEEAAAKAEAEKAAKAEAKKK